MDSVISRFFLSYPHTWYVALCPRCCGFEDDILQCRDVMEDAWVWVLRAFIMAVTVLLFLYFPVILPRGYRLAIIVHLLL